MLVGNSCTRFVISNFSDRNNHSNRILGSHGDGGCVSTKEVFKTTVSSLVLSDDINSHFLINSIKYSCN